MPPKAGKFKEGATVFGFLGCGLLIAAGPTLIVIIIVGHFVIKYW